MAVLMELVAISPLPHAVSDWRLDKEYPLDLAEDIEDLEYTEEDISEVSSLESFHSDRFIFDNPSFVIERSVPTTEIFLTCIETKSFKEHNSASNSLRRTLIDQPLCSAVEEQIETPPIASTGRPITYEQNTFHEVKNQVLDTPSRPRIMRFNNQFLRLYALDCNARAISKTLPLSDETNLPKFLNKCPNLTKFDQIYDLQAISSKSKAKLWASILLEPRDDFYPKSHVDHKDYIKLKSNNEKEFDGISRLAPTGILPYSKGVFNNESPNSGVSRCQYTSKGWVNKRWFSNGVI